MNFDEPNHPCDQCKRYTKSECVQKFCDDKGPVDVEPEKPEHDNWKPIRDVG